ncbi:MAG: hypothetical protein ABL959_23990 [Pyrinomonadaceae bacterium]
MILTRALFLVLLCLICSPTHGAQNNSPLAKWDTAYVNTQVFFDETKGIGVLVEYTRWLNTQLKLEVDIEAAKIGKKSDSSWLDKEAKWISARVQSSTPIKFKGIFRRIDESLREFAYKNGFVALLDSSATKRTNAHNLAIPDVTEEFIEYFNKKYPLN